MFSKVLLRAFYFIRLPDNNLFWSNAGIYFFFYPYILLQLNLCLFSDFLQLTSHIRIVLPS